LFLTSFVAIHLFGHSIISSYKYITLVFLKILTSFFIGSLDISDPNMNISNNLDGISDKFDK